jgi:hypothetical protein
MHNFPFVITIVISILALVFVLLLTSKLRAFIFLPDKGSLYKPEIGEPAVQVDAEHIAAIHAVLTHCLGATPESLRVTRIKPL